MDFIASILPDRIKKIPVHMDFEGQRRAERTFQIIIILFAVVGFVCGYIYQKFSITVYILGAGFAISCLLTLPPWPMYRLSPLEWQKERQIPPSEGQYKALKPAEKSKPKEKKRK